MRRNFKRKTAIVALGVIICLFVFIFWIGLQTLPGLPTRRLIRAAVEGKVDYLHLIVERGHWIRPFSDDELAHAILKAIESGQTSAFRFLYESRPHAVAGHDLLDYAVVFDNREATMFLLDDVGVPIDMELERAFQAARRNLLTLSVAIQSSEMVKLLLNYGVDVDAYDEDGGTALLEAVSRRNQELASVLLSAGADPNRPSSCQFRIYPIIFASLHADIGMVELLIEWGAKLSVVSLTDEGVYMDVRQAAHASGESGIVDLVAHLCAEAGDSAKVLLPLVDLTPDHVISESDLAAKSFFVNDLPNDYIAMEDVAMLLGRSVEQTVSSLIPLQWSHLPEDQAFPPTDHKNNLHSAPPRQE